VRLGPGLLHGAQQVQVVFVRQFGIDPAHHVNFADRDFHVVADALLDLFDRKHVPEFVLGFYVKGTELAEFVAHIGIIDMLVADVIGGVCVLALAHDVGQITQHGKLVAMVETQSIVGAEALASQNSGVYIRQARLVDQFLKNQNVLLHKNQLKRCPVSVPHEIP
jgi:hypothetical protein